MLGTHGHCAGRGVHCATPVVKLSFGHLLRQARVAADLISSYEINIIFYAWITNNMHSKRHTMNIFHISYNMFTFLFVFVLQSTKIIFNIISHVVIESLIIWWETGTLQSSGIPQASVAYVMITATTVNQKTLMLIVYGNRFVKGFKFYFFDRIPTPSFA